MLGQAERDMSLMERLSQDLRQATKSKDQLRMDVIRMIKAAITNKELELKKELDDAEMSRVMGFLVKQRREAAEQFHRAKRIDLAEKELKEVAIIEGYLPKAPSPDELAVLVDQAVKETEASTLKDMGLVMKTVMAKLAGLPVDGKHVSDLVRSKLR
jgi:uncharacterized protein YqeY